MKLTNMKLDKEAREKEPASVLADAPIYPWGLSVHLDDATLKKLGIGLPEVGKSMRLEARIEVTSSSENKTTDGTHRSASLQIVDLGIGADEGEGGSAADKLYSK